MTGMTFRSVGKMALMVTVSLIILGIIKVAAPDVWSKIPGLKEF